MPTILDYIRAEREAIKESSGRPRFGLPWSEEDDFDIRHLALCGLSRREIAERIGRNPDSVRKRCLEIGVRPIRDTCGGSYKTPYHVYPCENRTDQEERDREFIRAIAQAIYRGDHLPRKSNV